MDLNFVHESLGEQRAKRTVDQTSRQDFLGGGAAFALQEAAWELAGCGAAFAVVDLQREEVDAFARVGADDGAEDDGFAVLHRDGAGGELGIRTCFDRERAPADFLLYSNRLHEISSVPSSLVLFIRNGHRQFIACATLFRAESCGVPGLRMVPLVIDTNVSETACDADTQRARAWVNNKGTREGALGTKSFTYADPIAGSSAGSGFDPCG